jgi:hypothetical protein
MARTSRSTRDPADRDLRARRCLEVRRQLLLRRQDLLQRQGDGNVGPNTYYGEFSPRLSFGKIFDQKLEFGPIKDVLLAMTYEFGEGDTESYLIGPGFDLAIPGFDYFQLNFYQRHTEGSVRATTSGRSPRSGPTPFPVGARTS